MIKVTIIDFGISLEYIYIYLFWQIYKDLVNLYSDGLLETHMDDNGRCNVANSVHGRKSETKPNEFSNIAAEFEIGEGSNLLDDKDSCAISSDCVSTPIDEFSPKKEVRKFVFKSRIPVVYSKSSVGSKYNPVRTLG